MSLMVIYPGIGLSIKWLSSSYTPNIKIDCEILPAEHVVSVFLIEIVVMYLWIYLLPKVNDAVFLMFYGAFGFLSIGSFFLVLTHLVLFCPPISPDVYESYPFILGVIFLLAVLMFFYHLRPRTIKSIELNHRKIDFEKNMYSINESPVHVNSKADIKSIFLAAISAGFIGLAMAKYLSHDLSEDYRLFIFLIAMVFISYFFLGYMLLIQIYSGWIVYKKTRRCGMKMTIKEFD